MKPGKEGTDELSATPQCCSVKYTPLNITFLEGLLPEIRSI